MRENYPDVRILFPRDTDTDKQTIHIVGKKEEVVIVKKQLEAMVNELVSTFITLRLRFYTILLLFFIKIVLKKFLVGIL